MPRRILEIGSGIATGYATQVLTSVGWDVTKVIPSGYDSLAEMESRWGGGRGGASLFLDKNKRVVDSNNFDISINSENFDVVIGDFSERNLHQFELPASVFDSLKVGCSLISLTSFGLDQSLSNRAHSDLILQAASSLLYLTGEHHQAPQQLPPYTAEMSGGLAASSAVIASVRAYRLDKQVRRIDLSIVEALAIHSFTQSASYVHRGEIARREPEVKEGLRVVPTLDGYVYCAPGATASMRMDGLADLINEPRLKSEKFQTAEGRKNNYEEFVNLFVPPFKQLSAMEWFLRAEELHLTFSLIRTIDELFSCEQLNERGIWSEMKTQTGDTVRIPGAPFFSEPTL
jgi:crotonobetainyl-CoA:carnitine CoA-transferase CaiB-like acyl-CoA transferase